MRPEGANARPKLRAALLLLAVASLLVGTAWLTWHRRAGPNDESPATTAALSSSPANVGTAPQAGSTRAADTASAPNPPTDPGASSGTPGSPAAPTSPVIASNGVPRAGNTASPPASGNHGDASDGEESKLFPRDWRRCFGWSGGAREAYDFAADSSTYSNGLWSVRIRSRAARPAPAGASICQYLAATSYKGKRVRVTLHMRTRDAEPGAHMLFRADTASGQVVALYNMSPAWVRGDTDWAEYSAVLDVPESASAVIVAGTLVNTGTLWMDDASLEVVDPQTKVTQPPTRTNHYNQVIATDQLPTTLQNAGFEENFPVPSGE